MSTSASDLSAAQPHSTTALPRRVRVAAWVVLIAQVSIIVTSTAVRLTGSGLGCSDWPMCEPGSLTNTPEMGIHGFIEFGNRVLGVVLGIICLAALIVFWPWRRKRPELAWSAFALLMVVPVQAVIGGLSVLSKLNPWIVASHFIPSAASVAVAAYLIVRVNSGPGPRRPVGPHKLRKLMWVIAGLLVIVLVFGVLTTGAGPHAGDRESARNGLPTVWMARFHAFPVWLMVITAVWARVIAAKEGAVPQARAIDFLLAVTVLQGLIGYVQYFTGLPIGIVLVHMFGLTLVIMAAVFAIMSNYSWRAAPVHPADDILEPADSRA